MNKFFALLFLLTVFKNPAFSQNVESTLKGKIICVDPGHGGTALTDSYRVGPAGEREEWINLRVGILLRKMLEEKGATVIMTRTEDKFVPLPDRAKLAVDNKADLFVSIHHNATADSTVNFPIIYFHGNASENVASVDFGKALASSLLKHLHKPGAPVSLVSDFTIFAESGASVLRNSYGIPGVLAEASFFTNAEEEQKLKQEEHNRKEAVAFTEALEVFFSKPVQKIAPKNSVLPVIPAFKVFQEAERMTPVAKRWHQDFLEGQKLMSKKDTASLRQAYDLFTRSARSFPDSYVAFQCHANRAEILKMSGKLQESAQEAQRVKEYYVNFPKEKGRK
ncbi:N-acetylmuramoyl-L-alanine amidase [Dyadobacter flavalbus]|uniref:N-acetylmuramoyl-L-alanine amidase n=1 Tax=Dyadobacter flavalbus TaxID=2579942 RepID=A0A5M8R207_9BACT|nr:N-acetylmuramoyl-L-alanine amidase [Dyadobacter flavalbus]KAA6441350.1 N-acetylmuramoyl-L-alanine amidase [Dyadobacter flavalbus]